MPKLVKAVVIDNCSVIKYYHTSMEKMAEVKRRLELAQLPVIVHSTEDKVVGFYYNGICDGNTAFYLERIIDGLIELYKK
jgi:hypothetical protein